MTPRGDRGNGSAGLEIGRSKSCPERPVHSGNGFNPLFCAAFAKPAEGSTGLWPALFASKWYVTAALLAGPALSLPNMLVMGGVLRVKKTAGLLHDHRDFIDYGRPYLRCIGRMITMDLFEGTNRRKD